MPSQSLNTRGVGQGGSWEAPGRGRGEIYKEAGWGAAGLCGIVQGSPCGA